MESASSDIALLLSEDGRQSPSSRPPLFLVLGRRLVGFFRLVGRALLERGAENVAERSAGIRGAVLGDRLLLLGDFERLDRHRDLAAAAIELGDAGVDLLADRETLGALLGAVAGEFGTLDEGGEIRADDLHVDARFLDLGDLAGDDRALLEVAGLRERIRLELLDGERDALLLDIDVEHEEQAELGLVLDLALDGGTDRVLLHERLPRIAHRLLQPERDAALDRIDLEDLHFDLLRGRDDLAGVHVLLGPRHFRDVDQALDAGLELDEGAVVGDVGDPALVAGAHREFRLDALPRVVEQLLHAQRDAVGLVVDLDDLHLDLLPDVEHLGRVIDAPPGDVGDVEQPVDAAEIDEGSVVGDVLDHAVDDLALFEVLHQLLALLGPGLLEHGAAGDDDVAAAAIHFENLERLRHVHQRGDVADRPDVDLAARQEGDGAVEIDREAALDLVEDDALDLLVGLKRLFEAAPALLPARLVAREHRLAERVLDPLQIHLDGVADFQLVLAARTG